MAERLAKVEKLLEQKYPNLHISRNVTVSQDRASIGYLHLWKPQPTTRGLFFLPTFHIIVTPVDDDDTGSLFTVQLMTYHGRPVLEDTISTQASGQSKDIVLKQEEGAPPSGGYEILEAFSEDKYYLCNGVDKVNKKRLVKCLRRIKATHLDKVRNFFFMEACNDETVLRSRNCRFALTEDEERERKQREDDEDAEVDDGDKENSSSSSIGQGEALYRRCVECDKFQFKIQRIRKEMDGDDAIMKETEINLEEGQFRVMKEDSKAFFWNDTVVYSGKKIQMMDIKRERGGRAGNSDDEDWDPSTGSSKRGKKRSSRGPGGNQMKRERTDEESDFAMTCTICLHTYPSLNSYEIDQRRHARAFDLRELVNCPLCEGLDPMEKKDLTVHFHDAHSELGTCCCECLEIMSPEDDQLRKHMLKKHSEALKSKCPMCPTTFTEKYRLKVHIKQMHEKTAEAICDHCGKLFGHRSLMVKHRRLAHGAKTFICTICEKGFTSIFALNKHLNVHSGLKPFKCIDCDYRSCRLTNVWLHVKKMHGRKGTHADVEVFEDELKQMQAMELDNVPYKPPEYGEGLEELDEVYVQEEAIQDEDADPEVQEEVDLTEIHVIQELQVVDEQ